VGVGSSADPVLMISHSLVEEGLELGIQIHGAQGLIR
jgi:hypothetical protein